METDSHYLPPSYLALRARLLPGWAPYIGKRITIPKARRSARKHNQRKREKAGLFARDEQFLGPAKTTNDVIGQNERYMERLRQGDDRQFRRAVWYRHLASQQLTAAQVLALDERFRTHPCPNAPHYLCDFWWMHLNMMGICPEWTDQRPLVPDEELLNPA